MKLNLQDAPHRRWNPLKREWVLVSPHRTQRPWQGHVEDTQKASVTQYDPACYLCPGNTRAGGNKMPSYTGTYIFDNDFAALLPQTKHESINLGSSDLIQAETERGICRVLCFDPRHDLTLATLDPSAIRRVVDAWAEQESELGNREDIQYVQIFENRGQMMGASNPHPHGQIWATEHLPNEPLREMEAQREYLHTHRQPLLPSYLAMELLQDERIVFQNATWVALVPFWAVWPFELLVLPRRQVATITSLRTEERDGLAECLKAVTTTYNQIFNTPFPYSMGLHPAPADGEAHEEWQLHLHFYPPLLRSATVRKFMVGFELLGSPQRDITPELAAKTMKDIIAGNK